MNIKYIVTILGISLLEVTCYNIDTSNPVIFDGGAGILFGFKTTFVSHGIDRIKLLISAPTSSSRDTDAGRVYICNPDDPSSCEELYIEDNYGYLDNSGVVKPQSFEGFGWTVNQISPSRTLMCAPRWKDLRTREYLVVGRCVIVDIYNTNKSTSGVPIVETNEEFQKTVSIEFPKGTSSSQTFFFLGMAEMGFSADAIANGSYVLGSPGMNEWTGGFQVVNDFDYINGIVDVPNSGFPHLQQKAKDYMYLGYAVAAGRFCDGNRLCFAVGAPRHDHSGKVYVYESLDNRDVVVLDALAMIDGAIGSYFGSVLCAADLNGDGYDDVVVGAPTYTDTNKNETLFSNEGRVLVYYSLGNAEKNRINFSRKPAILRGLNKAFAGFGSSISNLGDLNGDNVDDIAIGAPNEDSGMGAVYIYHGGAAGVNTDYSQRIEGRMISENITGFGFHISNSMDVNGDTYPDMAIGCLYSGKAVILKSRPIIDIVADMNFDNDLIRITRTDCPRNRTDTESCFNLNICFTFSGVSVPQDIVIQYNISVDFLKTELHKRAVLEEADDNLMFVGLIKGDKKCTQHSVLTYEKQRKSDPFSRVQVVTSFKMVEAKGDNTAILPIVNNTRPDSVTKDTYFQLKCGEDNICDVDLSLKGHVIYEKMASFITVNKTDRIHLKIKLSNSQDESFGSSVSITWDENLLYRRVIASHGQPVICSSSESETKPMHSNLKCDILEPMTKNQSVDFKVILDADKLSLKKSEINFNLSASTYSKDINRNNNVANFSSPVWIVAIPETTSNSEPSEVFVNMDRALESQNISITHRYQMMNQGPSYLPPTSLLIELPAFYKTGEELIKTPSAKLQYGDGEEEGLYCEFVAKPSYGSQVPLSTKNTPTSATVSTAASTTETTTRRDNTESKTTVESTTGYPVRPPSRRKREVHNRTDANNKIHHMNCENYDCGQLICNLSKPVQKGESIVVNVEIEINPANFPLKDNDVLSYTTKLTVKKPEHILFLPWNYTPTTMVSTLIYKDYDMSSFNIWILLYSIVPSLILLVIIAIILKKCGFFKREKKNALQKWKRESGFYQCPNQQKSRQGSERSRKESEREQH